MRMMFSFVAAATMTVAAPAVALPISADLFESLNLPTVGAGAPRIFSSPGAVFGAGAELDITHETQNPSN